VVHFTYEPGSSTVPILSHFSVLTTLVKGRTCVTIRVVDEALLVHNYRIRSQYVSNRQQSICRQRECYTFTSGATQAWVLDETREEPHGKIVVAVIMGIGFQR
jgi:hypothetical protein